MKKILLVDDNKDLLDLVGQILKSHNFDIHTYESGHDVAGVVKNYNPDLILLDVRLGEFDGTNICKELKKSYNIPIVLFSADATKGRAFVDCDADGFIEKPFDISEFITSIKSYLKNVEEIY